MATEQPTPIDLVRELREALGMFAGAMPITPQQAWDEALERVRGLAQGRCHVCMEEDRGDWPHGEPRLVRR